MYTGLCTNTGFHAHKCCCWPLEPFCRVPILFTYSWATHAWFRFPVSFSAFGVVTNVCYADGVQVFIFFFLMIFCTWSHFHDAIGRKYHRSSYCNRCVVILQYACLWVFFHMPPYHLCSLCKMSSSWCYLFLTACFPHWVWKDLYI